MNSINEAAAARSGKPWPGDPTPLAGRQKSPWRWVGPAISAAILIAVFFQLRELHIADVRAIVPTSIGFWLVFPLFYFAPVVADFAIFRWLWGIPASGFFALLRKLISNDLLFGYIGEVYFYSWARKKLAMETSPFGAVKDVAILSAVAGNAVTLVMMIAAYPLLGHLQLDVLSERLHVSTGTLLISFGAVLAISMLPVALGNRLFSLTRAQLFGVTGIHLLRIIVTTSLSALVWNLALPQVDLSWWVVLSTVRLLISRLPFVPQKDIVFAGIAVFMVGHDLEIAALMTFMATIVLVTHIVLGVILALADFVSIDREEVLS